MKRIFILALLTCFFSVDLFAQDPAVAQDIKMGKEADQMVREQMGIYHNKISEEYLNEVGQKVAAQVGNDLPFKFTFKLVNMVEPNAFSIPGGYVYFSRGILPLLNSEDELATILGHEIAHVVRRHSARQMKKSIVPALLTVPGLLISGISPELGGLINAPINAAGQIYLANYSRGQENEADEIGVLLAAKAGYEPKALGKALDQIDKAVEVYIGEKTKFSIFDDHPYTPDRVKNIQELSQKIKPKPGDPIAKTSSDFNHFFFGLHLQDDPEQGIFDGQKFYHPGLRFSMTFPEKWRTVNSPTAVGATNKKQDAMVVMGVPDEGGKHVQYGKKFLEKASKSKIQILESGESKFKNLNSFEIKFITGSEKNPTKGHMIWFTYQNLTFQLAGMWQGANKDTVDAALQSFSGVTTDELKKLRVLTLSLEKAKQGESIEDFSKRTGNAWRKDFFSVVNDLGDQSSLNEGQELKIAIWTPLKF